MKSCVTPALSLLTILLSLSDPGRASNSRPGASASGDVIIGGIFPIHEAVEKKHSFSAPLPQKCVRFDPGGLSMALAMISAINTMNNSPILNRLGITLGYRIYDSCADVSTALQITATLMQGGCNEVTNSTACDQAIMAVVGATTSELSIATARQLTLAMIPQISYSSTAITLSDKNRFPAFMRTVPSDLYQTRAMVKMMVDNNWTWVGVIITDGDYGHSALESFSSQASDGGICVAFKEIFPDSVIGPDVQLDIRRAARTILQNPRVKVIVSFSRSAHMKYLFRELVNQVDSEGLDSELMKRIWIASDSWSSSGSVHGQIPLDGIGHVVGFTFKQGNLSSFYHYLDVFEAAGLQIAGNMSFIEELQSNATKDPDFVSRFIQDLKASIFGNIIVTVEMAVSAIAHAVADLCYHRDCKQPHALQPWEVLRALRSINFKYGKKNYMFDSRGDINSGYDITMWRSEKGTTHVQDIVAEYHPLNNSFTPKCSSGQQLTDLKSIVSRCSNSCVPGKFKKTAVGQHTCCYECSNCTENYYSNATDMDQCLSCDPDKYWSPEGSPACILKTLEYFSWQDGFAVALLTLAVLGMVLILLVGILFLWKHETPVVKAAGGPLCHIILLSLVGSFISAIMFVGNPTKLQCMSRQVLYGLSFTLCVSCILVKSIKIILAFQFNPGLQNVLNRLYKPYVIIASCVALQVATCISWLVLKNPDVKILPLDTTRLAECDEGSYVAFGVMLAYIAVLALVCFFCAFKGRKLPQRYNEARFITFSTLLYLMSWLIFIPVYVTTSGMYVQAVEMVVILISNYGILSCHFFPKCYMILFRKEQNTRDAFRQNVYEYSNRSTETICVSNDSLPEGKYTSKPNIICIPPCQPPSPEPKLPLATYKENDFKRYFQSNIFTGLVTHQHNRRQQKCHWRCKSI